MQRVLVIYMACIAWQVLSCTLVQAQTQVRNIYCNVHFNPVAQAESAQVQAIIRFKKSLEQRSAGTFQVHIGWNTRLTSTYQGAQLALMSEKMQLAQIPCSTLAGTTSALLPLSSFYVFSYPDIALPRAVVEGPAGDSIRRRVLKETGLRIMAFWALGYRHLTSVELPLDDLEALRGQPWRVQQNAVHEDALAKLGVKPVFFARSELYETLRHKRIGGAEGSLADILEGRLYEMQKNLLLTGHAFEFMCIVTSEHFYASLSREQRQHWDAAMNEATQLYHEIFAKNTVSYAQKIRNLMYVREMSMAQQVRFRQAGRSANVLAAQMAGPEYYAEIMKEIDKLRVPSPDAGPQTSR